MQCSKAEERLKEFFVARGEPMDAETRTHLDGCDSCRSLYDELFAAEAALGEPEEDSLSVTEMEMMSSRVFADTPGRRSRPARLFAVLATCSAAAAAAVIFLLNSANRDEFAARGTSQDQQPLSIRLLCVTGSGTKTSAHSVALDDGTATQSSCPTGSNLLLLYSNRGQQNWYSKVLVSHSSGRTKHLLPASGKSITLGPSEHELPIDLQIAMEPYSAQQEVLVQAYAAPTADGVGEMVGQPKPSNTKGLLFRWRVLVSKEQP